MSDPISCARPAHRVDPQAFQCDPHETFAALRPHHPIVELGERHLMVLRASAVRTILGHPLVRQVEGAEYVALNGIPDGTVARLLRDFFLFANGDAHKAKRGPFARAFSYGAIRAARPKVRETARRIVAEMPRGAAFDFVAEVAARIGGKADTTDRGLCREVNVGEPHARAQQRGTGGVTFGEHVMEPGLQIGGVAQHERASDVGGVSLHHAADIDLHQIAAAGRRIAAPGIRSDRDVIPRVAGRFAVPGDG